MVQPSAALKLRSSGRPACNFYIKRNILFYLDIQIHMQYCLLTKPVNLEENEKDSGAPEAVKSRELATATHHSSGEHHATLCTRTARTLGRITTNLCYHSKYKDVNYRSTKQNLRFRQVQNLKVFSVLELQRTFVQFHHAH